MGYNILEFKFLNGEKRVRRQRKNEKENSRTFRGIIDDYHGGSRRWENK